MDRVNLTRGFDGIYDYVEIPPNPRCPKCGKPMRLIKSRGIYVCRWCGLKALGRVVIELGVQY